MSVGDYNKFLIWGTKCNCGNQCSILQNEHHPWDETDFKIKLKCEQCGSELVVDKSSAEIFYNNKIYGYYENLYGNVIDLGCGGGFLSRRLLSNKSIEKIYGIDLDEDCAEELKDIRSEKFNFINLDLCNLSEQFLENSIDFLVSRDVFMFIEDTNKYLDDVTKIVKKEIRQMGWYIESNSRIKNKLSPNEIKEEYEKRGWNVELEYLNWYKGGYFIKANK